MSAWKEFMRSWLKPTPRNRRVSSRQPLRVERLEYRDTPSITVVGAPQTYTAVGPTSITNAANVDLGSNPIQNIQEGAVNSIAVDPFNAGHVILGAVNGGIWSTSTYGSPTVNWTTSTDNMPSLAISQVAFSPTLQNVVYAGTGSFTAGGLGPNFAGSALPTEPGDGGPAVGIYKSTDGGQTWTVPAGSSTFNGLRISALVPTSLNGGQTIFAATNDNTGVGTGGLYRSDDGGTTWTRLSGEMLTTPSGTTISNGLPDLGVTSVIADPGDPNRFYAFALGTGGGVFTLDTTGGNQLWENISTNLPAAISSGDRVLLAASGAGVDPVYAAVIGPVSYGEGPIGIYRAVPFTSPTSPTATTYVWTAIGPGGLPPDVSPGGQATTHFAIIADPTSDHIVYVAGDRINNTDVPFSGNVARGDALADTWTTVTYQPAGEVADPGTTTPLDPGPQAITAPHADIRSLTFAGTGAILAGTDGGIYLLSNPQAKITGPVWSSLNTNLQITEVYQAATEDLGTASTTDDVILAAAQDNGADQATVGKSWAEVVPGDGTLAQVDNTNKYEYFAGEFFNLYVRNPQGVLAQPNGTINGTALSLIGNTPFKPIFAFNQADSNQILVGGLDGTHTLFLSTDHANTFTSIGGITGGQPADIPNLTGTVTAIAFGTSQIRNAAYVATDDGNISQSFDITSNNGNFTLTDFLSVAGGEAAYAIAMDPNNPLIAYAVTANGVYETVNGKHWVNISGNLPGLVAGAGLTPLNSILLFTNGQSNPNSDILLVGGFGGIYKLPVGNANVGNYDWVKFGTGLPNVVVTDIVYDSLEDVLTVATYGRGIFRLTNATSALNSTPTVVVTGGSSTTTATIAPDPTNANNYIVTDGQGNTETFATITYPAVSFTAGTGNFYLDVEQSSQLGVKISADGSLPEVALITIDDSKDTIGRQVTITPTTVGKGAGDDLFAAGGSITYTNYFTDPGFAPSGIQLDLDTAFLNQVIYDDSANSVQSNYYLTTTTATLANPQVSGMLSRATAANSILNVFYHGNAQFNLYGSSAGSTYGIQSTVGPVVVVGGAGNDSFNLASDAPTDNAVLGSFGGQLSINGNGGYDTISTNGTGGSDTIITTLSTLTANTTTPGVGLSPPTTVYTGGSGSIGGIADGIFFADITNLNFNGLTGSDAFRFVDATAGAHGTALHPQGGVVYSPTGAASGTLSLGGVVMSLTAITNGLTVYGSGTQGTPDTLLILAPSGTGLQTAYGEPVLGTGQNQIVASDSQVSINSTSEGPLLPVNIYSANGVSSFATIYIRTGNSQQGSDQVTATPSTMTNLVIDAVSPVTNPNAKLIINGTGPYSTVSVNNPSLGPPQTQLTDDSTGGTLGYLNFTGGTTFQGSGVANGGTQSSGLIAVATGVGTQAQVEAFDRLTGALRFTVTPFPGFKGGISVATGDVTGDGIADVVVGAGPGGGPLVEVYSGVDGSFVGSFYAYSPSFRGGVNVSTGDMNGSGHDDIITGTGPGGGPELRVFDGITYASMENAFVYNPNFRGGVNVAVGDVNGDGTPDFVTSTGAGGGPQVMILDGKTLAPIASFFAFDPNSRSGFSVAVGDVNGDGRADIVVGSGAGAASEIKVFSGLNQFLINDFYMNEPFSATTSSTPTDANTDGVEVAVADVNGDGIGDVLAVNGAGATHTLHAYQIAGVNTTTNALFSDLQEISQQPVFGGGTGYGLNVGGSD